LPRFQYEWMVSKSLVPKKFLKYQENFLMEATESGSFAVDPSVAREVIESTGGTPKNIEYVMNYLKNHDNCFPGMPCVFYHPKDDSCIRHGFRLWTSAFSSMFPVYFSLTAIPMVFFKFSSITKHPLSTFKKTMISVTKSSAFIAFLLSTFKAGMCSFFQLFPERSTKAFAYVWGCVASLWIFLEQKSRRPELAMFSLPKAVHSFYLILIDNGRILPVPHMDVAGGCISLSILMSLYQLEPHHISGLLFKLMRATIGDY
jgi:hypothetical protein